MKISIRNIAIATRIRKEVTNIAELAADIKVNGLISPIAIMPLEGEKYQLLAGLRRIRAAEFNGETEIEANIVPAIDAESALKIEFAENEQREDFTYSEKMDYATMIQKIESVKAQERMLAGKSNADPHILRCEGAEEKTFTRTGYTDDIIAPKIGMSPATYVRAKYVAKNAPSETIEKLDSKEKTITGVYNELRAEARKAQNEAMNTDVVNSADNCKPMPQIPPPVYKAKHSPPPMIIPQTPEEEVKSLRYRAATAESELSNLKDIHANAVSHKDSIIASLQMQLANTVSALAAANARITELEAMANVHTD
ncbi:hypothetical protein FACS1894105_05410 [Clostridia bacterium]|nr:hypothetical protein FACS1894105_05410 [Clostridia bacterium]